MNSLSRHDPRSDLAIDVVGSAIALAIVWGAFSMLFGSPATLSLNETAAPAATSASFDIYDSVMTQDQDWLMLASR